MTIQSRKYSTGGFRQSTSCNRLNVYLVMGKVRINVEQQVWTVECRQISMSVESTTFTHFVIFFQIFYFLKVFLSLKKFLRNFLTGSHDIFLRHSDNDDVLFFITKSPCQFSKDNAPMMSHVEMLNFWTDSISTYLSASREIQWQRIGEVWSIFAYFHWNTWSDKWKIPSSGFKFNLHPQQSKFPNQFRKCFKQTIAMMTKEKKSQKLISSRFEYLIFSYLLRNRCLWKNAMNGVNFSFLK